MTDKVAALILAAGASERFGGPNKLLADLTGRPMLVHAVQQACASGADPVFVVTGRDKAEVQAAVLDHGLSVKFIENDSYAEGLSTSLKAGLAALGPDVAGVLVMLGDMPLVGAETLDRLIQAHAPENAGSVVVPYHDGRQGNPVLWGRAHFAALMKIDGDAGAKKLLVNVRDQITPVACGAEVLRDIDTGAALHTLRGDLGGP